jgi:hypothetical protein
MGWRRESHRIEPGLYAVGCPTPESPVFVTANYTLSFDALRASLKGVDGYIMVLDTKGINVWCAAGKGTFGTDELVNRIEVTGLAGIVTHRKLILPQLGAAGVSAHEVKQRSGFSVEYGPVRAADLPQYLKSHQAAPEMRLVTFPLKDRVVLIPVELTMVLKYLIPAALAVYILGGLLPTLALLAAALAGIVLFPVLLPWLPAKSFSAKGFILGFIAVAPFAYLMYIANGTACGWRALMSSAACILALTPVTAYIALNFTGSTPFTSRTGVKREMKRYIPVMLSLFVLGVTTALILLITRWIGR